MVNGVLYFTIPDKVWAVDARSGQEIWNYHWTPRAAFTWKSRRWDLRNWLYFETPDCNLGFAQHQGRQGTLAPKDLRYRPVLLRVGSARGNQETMCWWE